MSGKRRIKNYYLLEEIGAGGMAKVFLASKVSDKKKYAVKVLQPKMAQDPEILSRFLREIKIISRLEHPRIVKIYEGGKFDGCYYFVMDYLPGGNLNRLLEDTSCSHRKKIEIMISVCDALAYSHQNGIVHRDLKPGNILLDEQDAPVLADFGVAQVSSATMKSLTKSDVVLGTLNYLSPEQRQGARRVDHRSDIYALGVILYQLFTGQIPLGRFALPTEINPKLPRPMESVVLRCLELDPMDRFPTVVQLQQALTEVLPAADFGGTCTGPNPGALSLLPSETQKIDVNARKRYHIEPVLDVLRHGTATERFEATRDLSKLADASTIEILLQLLASEEEKVKWSIIKVLGEKQDRRAVDALIEALNNPFCQEVAAEALGKIGDPRALPPLIDLLNSNEEFSSIALVPIGRLGGSEAIPIVAKFLCHKYAHIRECAVEALTQIDDEAVLPFLKQCAQKDPCERVRKKARLAQGGINTESLRR